MTPNGGGYMPAGCEKCGSLTFNQDWFNAFAVMICSRCSKTEKMISKVRTAAIARSSPFP